MDALLLLTTWVVGANPVVPEPKVTTLTQPAGPVIPAAPAPAGPGAPGTSLPLAPGLPGVPGPAGPVFAGCSGSDNLCFGLPRCRPCGWCESLFHGRICCLLSRLGSRCKPGCSGSRSCTAHLSCEVGLCYRQPPMALPNQWIDANDPKVRHGEPNLCSWWDVFDDPLLTKLLHDSFANYTS